MTRNFVALRRRAQASGPLGFAGLPAAPIRALGTRLCLAPLICLLLLAMPAFAAVGTPEERLRDPAQEARAEAIGRQLRCLVCQNQSIEDSDADLARDLRRVVRERVAAGEDSARVIDFVHARYGDFVLLRPPVNAVTALLWATPAIALGGGILAVLLMRRRIAATPEPSPLTEAERARLAELDETPRV